MKKYLFWILFICLISSYGYADNDDSNISSNGIVLYEGADYYVVTDSSTGTWSSIDTAAEILEETLITYRNFFRFLQENNAYQFWIENISLKGRDINEFLKNAGPNGYIFSAFIFNKTPQGHYFWQDLDDKWEWELRSISEDITVSESESEMRVSGNIITFCDGQAVPTTIYFEEKGDDNMFTFMLGVLGSSMFWIVYGGLSLVVTTIILKNINPNEVWNSINGEFDFDGMDFIVLFFTLFFWPVIILCYVFGFTIKFLFFQVFCNAIKAIDKALPKIRIIKDTEEE